MKLSLPLGVGGERGAKRLEISAQQRVARERGGLTQQIERVVRSRPQGADHVVVHVRRSMRAPQVDEDNSILERGPRLLANRERARRARRGTTASR